MTLHGRASTSGTLHPVVLGQPIGTLWSNIRARPTARSPLCRPDASVSPLQVPAAPPSVRGAHPGEVRRLFGHGTTPPRMYEGPVRHSGGIAIPQGPRPASSDMAPHRPACMRARLDGTVYLGGSNAARCCFGPSYGCGSVVAGAGTRHAAPGCAPPHRRRCGARRQERP